jgi:AcrR family transcriptional regulator
LASCATIDGVTETGRVWGGMTTAEREERRREQFLEAGLEVFGVRGWSGTTVLDVCRAARLSQRYFYEHFAGREALFLAVVDRIAEQVVEVVRVAAVAEGRTTTQRVEGVLAALAEYFTADPRTIRVSLVESFSTERFRARRAELIASFSDLAAGLMATLAPAPGEADPRSLELSALILSGGVAEALVASISGRTPADAPELVAHLTRLYTAAARL